ncbi:MAG: metallopeptidase TldD-related protein [Sandaracinaceae bacterium]
MRPAPRRLTRLADALEGEAHRAMSELKAPGHRRPYFVSYLVRDVAQRWFAARFGTLMTRETRRWRRGYADVRLGSYRTDHVRDGGLGDNNSKAESFGYGLLPIGTQLDGVLHGVWQLTEARYREAAEDWLDKRAESLHYRDENAGMQAFERRPPTQYAAVSTLRAIDDEAWVRFVEKASAIGKRATGIYGCEVELSVRDTTRVFVSTEGSRVLDTARVYQLTAMLDYASEAGVTVPWTLSWFVRDPDELPDLSAMKAAMRRAFRTMKEIAAAETLRAYSGPVLLDPRPSGLLMHEALGHRLEGSRLLSPGEGQTFRGALGVQLLPESISLSDDPTQTHFEGRSLVGHYSVDDEGVPSLPTELVRGGFIRGYLSTRAGIGPRHHSNGHARSEAHERPISRMGVTFVEAADALSDAEMKARLLEEVKRRGLPFGIHVLQADSGETATSSYDFQAFLGQIRAAKRIYLDGREEWVRDVSFVGTPLNAVRGIVAAGGRREVDNSYCGAESGAVPVSTVSPALLLESLELQSSARSPHAAHTYRLPWSK